MADYEFIQYWECPKCDHEDSVWTYDSDLKPLSEQINEHMKEAHNITNEETLQDLHGEIWKEYSHNVQMKGRVEPIY
tara:strand:- start:115 stop:345 length:231 start_codon:yes stop_codon:yes gene_type:complete